MSSDQTVNFGIPKESFTTGIADARTFNEAMDAIDAAIAATQTAAADVKDSVTLATAAALPTCTAAGAGIGKTLTADAVGVLTVDGTATVINDRLLVKDQVAGKDNGIYLVTTEGTAGVEFVLTRATDADTNTKVTAGMYTFVSEGTANGDNGFHLTTDDPIVLDTDALVFGQTSSVGHVHEAAELDGATAAGIHTGPICAKRIASAELELLLDTVENNLFAVGAGDRILELVFNVETAAGAACTVDFGFDAAADGSAKDENGWIEAADANAAAPYSSTDATYDGVYVLPGKVAAAAGNVIITSSSDQSTSAFTGECYVIYMKG